MKKISVISVGLLSAFAAFAQTAGSNPGSSSGISVPQTTIGANPNGLPSMTATGLGMVNNYVSSYLGSWLSQTFKDYFGADQGVTEFSAAGFMSGKPVIEALITRPLYESDDKAHTIFYQASLERQDDRTTGNIGVGYRRLAYNKRLIFGVNAFYDQEFPYDHQRMSIGGEIRTTVAELNANFYQALSGWKDVGGGLEEKALGGYDLEGRIALPYLPAVKAGIKTFRWFGVDGEPDLTGNTYSLTGELPHGLSVEGGHTVYNSQPSSDYIKFTYNLAAAYNQKKTQALVSDVPYEFGSMEDHRLDKVRRENLIVKQVRGTVGVFRVVGY